MLTKGAIGNLVNRYKAVLTKCNLINTFGSLAIAAALVLGGAGVAEAAELESTTSLSSAIKENSNVKNGESVKIESTIGTMIINKSNATTEELIINFGDGSSLNIVNNHDSSNTVVNALNGKIDFNLGNTGKLEIESTNTFKSYSGMMSGNVNVYGGSQSELILKNTGGKDAVLADGHYGGKVSFDVDKLEIYSTSDIAIMRQNKNESLDIKAREIEITGRVQQGGNGSTNIHGFESLVIDGGAEKALVTAAGNMTIEGGDDSSITLTNDGSREIVETYAECNANVNIGADKVNIVESENAENTVAINANSGNINIKADILNIAADNAINVTKDGSVNFNSHNEDVEQTLVVIGDINVEDGGVADIQFTGSSSKLSGVANINGEKASLAFNNGATWNATGDSNVTKLDLNNANVNIADGAKVEVDNLSGESATATIGASANEEEGTVSSGSLVAKNSSLKKLSVAYEGIDADDFASKEAAAKFAQESVNLGEDATTEVSGLIEGGDINGDITIDGDGNATMGKNELMDAALQQASVTMVSLDKILTNDVRKRLGDIRSDANTTGVWMRWDGGKLKGDSGLTNNFNTIQIGGDTKAAKNCRIGFAGSFTHGDTEFSRGNGELEGFSFALYGTWMGENGMFADVVARLGKFSTEMNVDSMKGDMDNRVASLSAEYGWRLPICQQFFVEPQVELAYTYVSSDDLQLGDNHYEFDSVDSLTGRAGVVAGWNLPDERGNLYARASVVQQFMGDAKISGSNGTAHNIQEIDGEDTWLEYGIGANVKLTESTYLWADVERTEGADIEEEWRGTVGVRFSF